MTNHNAYYMKQIGSTANWVNIETFLSNTLSVSEITGIGDFGGSKNILFEEFNDSNEINVLAPTEEVAYEPTDVSIKLLIEGNATAKPTMTASNLQLYVSKGIYFKDTFRQLGNILYLQDTTINSAQINLITNSASTAEYCLLNLKFKKKYAIDIPILFVTANTFEVDHTVNQTSIDFIWGINDAVLNNQFYVEQGFYIKKSTDTNYVKHITNTTYNSFITKMVTGLTSSTTYNVYPFITTRLETYTGAVENITTLA